MDVCDCGRVIEQPMTGRRRSRCLVCSPKREREQRRAPVVSLPSRQVSEVLLTVAGSTLADLRRFERDRTTTGVIALHLANLIDAGGYTAQGAAALVKAHREALDIALAGTGGDADVIDMIFGQEA
jgi:hypothetical protein